MYAQGHRPEVVIRSELLGITAVAAGAQQISSTLDISKYQYITLFIDHARDEAAAFVGAGTEYKIQVSEKASGSDTWRTLTSAVCDITAASDIIMDGNEAAGQTIIETGATLPAVNDIVFFKNATIANSEWVRVTEIDNTGGTEHFHISDGLTNAQAQLAHIYNKAEQFVISLTNTAYTRLRVVVNNANGSTNKAIVCRVAVITR